MNEKVRAMKADDWRDLYEIWTDPKVCWGTLQTPFQCPDDVRKKVESAPEGMYRLVAEVDGRVVGASNLRRGRSPRMQHVADCGVSVHSDYWGQGVGSALVAAVVDLADNWLNIKRIELEVYTDNEGDEHIEREEETSTPTTRRRSTCTRNSALPLRAPNASTPSAKENTWTPT